jgi:signal transduction histidine kinase
MTVRARLWPGLRTRSIWLDVLLAFFSWAPMAITVLAPRPAPGLWIPVFIGTVVLAVLLALFRRSRPLVPFLAAAGLSAAHPAGSFGMLLASYAVGRYVGRWPVRWTAAAVGAVALLQPWTWTSASKAIGTLGGVAVLLLLPGAIGIYVRTRAQLLIALRERAERAESERELLARDAVLTERTRIAREMHDAVGHRVSLMVLQAGAIEMAAADRQRVEQLAGQVQDAGRQALEELRQMVGVLRAGEESAPLAPQPGLDDVPRLVEQSRAAGMDVALTMNGHAPVDPAVGRAAYRIVQEALTNGGKHAPGAHVAVTVEHPAHALLVRVVNGPPRGTPTGVTGGGFGLVGLAERVRTLGGHLTAEPRLDGGFLVEAELPT